MAEHLGLEQLLGQGRTVERNENLVRAPAVPVNELREHFLAGPAFAHQHHRRVRRRDLSRQIDCAPEGGRYAEQGGLVAGSVLLLQVCAGLGALTVQQHRVRRAAEHQVQVRAGKRLWQILPRPDSQRLDTGSHARVARHHDDERVRLDLQHRLEDIQARHRRHV